MSKTNTDSKDANKELSKVLLDVYYKGKDGTGFSDYELQKTMQQINSLMISRSDLAEEIGEPKLGDFDIKPLAYDDVIKAITWYKNRIAKLKDWSSL